VAGFVCLNKQLDDDDFLFSPENEASFWYEVCRSAHTGRLFPFYKEGNKLRLANNVLAASD